MIMDTISRLYIELAFAIEQYNQGYIDGYYGPDVWKSAAQRSLEELAVSAETLADMVNTLSEADRRAFLVGQVHAMQASIALLRGEPIDYIDEVRRLYGIDPAYMPERIFDQAISALDALLPGEGDIAAREQAFRRQFEVPLERLDPLLDVISAELGRRTRARYQLPEHESFEIQLVRDQPWGGYNWYLGNAHSRIDINTDLPIRLHGLPDLIAHEAYPGHHTEHAIKEEVLFRQQGRGEHAILLINAPECVVSEGIATRARSMVMDDSELRDWLNTDLAPLAGLQGADIDTMLEIGKARENLRWVAGNAAMLIHAQGASAAESAAYIERYGLARPEEARKQVQFLTHPNFRSYIFTYTYGGQLLDQLFATGSADQWFGRLLREPVTPGEIRTWISTAMAGPSEP